jgi:SSS family solute:Na+ symporter
LSAASASASALPSASSFASASAFALSCASFFATLSATVIGGSATIVAGALIYRSGLPGLWLDIGGAIGLIILGFTIAKLVRKTGLFTLPEIAGYLFDKKTRFAASFLIIITQIAWVALLIQATSAVIGVIFPIENVNLILIGITIIFIIYTFIGGQYSVVYTDIIQFLVMFVGVCCFAVPLLLIKAGPDLSKLTSGTLSFPINNQLGFLPVLSFFFMMLMTHIVGPDIYNKVLSAKDEKTAKLSVISAGIFKFIFAIAIGILALCAIVLINPTLPAVESATAIPKAITYLNPVIAGFILAALVSAMLSSADSVLLSAGTILSIDIIRKKNIFISRIGIIIIGLLALILALYLNSVLDTLKLAYTVFASGLTLPIIFGFYKNKTKVTSKGALISLIVGGSISLLWLFFANPYGIDAIIIGLICSVIPLIIFMNK